LEIALFSAPIDLLYKKKIGIIMTATSFDKIAKQKKTADMNKRSHLSRWLSI
jgi:hypothetical protein